MVATLFKGLVASILWDIAVVIGQLLPGLFGIPVPAAPEGLNAGYVLLLYVLGGIPLSIVLGEMFVRLRQPFWERTLSIFVFHYLVYGLAQVTEQIIFTPGMSLAFGAVANVLPAVVMALVVAWLWKPTDTSNTFAEAFRGRLGQRGLSDWTWRTVTAWLIYLPIYYLVGRAISPLVAAYYTDAEAQLSLVLPDVQTMVDMQFIRGALFVFAVFPIVVLWRHSVSSLWKWLGLAILVQLAVVPMIVGYWLPFAVRLPHAFELSIDSFAQAYIYTQLLYIAGEDRSGPQQLA